ncbi:MAG: LysR family transcriptional regulator [Verrucomicrobiota bacterium]
MNVHHLELFYFVAKHKGITAAVRAMPYGIQQPAVSGQLAKLEADLGVKLFNRRPFALTPEGEELYRHIEPFFSGLGNVRDSLTGTGRHHLRVAASAIVLADHLPKVLNLFRRRHKELKLTVREVPIPDIEVLLDQQEIDFGISALTSPPDPPLRSLPLLKLKPILLVPVNSKHKSLKSILAELKKSDLPLISLPGAEPLSRIFREELSRRKVVWPPSIEASSLRLVETYVASGFGIGVSLLTPGRQADKRVRVVPLPGFPLLEIAAVFQGKLKPIAAEFLAEAKSYANSLARKKG